MMEHDPPAIATLELNPDATAPTGTLSSEHGLRIECSGWAELGAAIEEWRVKARRYPHPERTDLS
jgi:hypothetical protein